MLDLADLAAQLAETEGRCRWPECQVVVTQELHELVAQELVVGEVCGW